LEPQTQFLLEGREKRWQHGLFRIRAFEIIARPLQSKGIDSRNLGLVLDRAAGFSRQECGYPPHIQLRCRRLSRDTAFETGAMIALSSNRRKLNPSLSRHQRVAPDFLRFVMERQLKPLGQQRLQRLANLDGIWPLGIESLQLCGDVVMIEVD